MTIQAIFFSIDKAPPLAAESVITYWVGGQHMRSRSFDFRAPVAATLIGLCAATAASGNELVCGSLNSAFGPFDFRTISDYDKDLVERAHFTLEVESLLRGSSGALGQDLTYTLRAIPNHPRALLAISKLSLRTKDPKPHKAGLSIDCFFERGMRFQPNDPFPPVLYALHKIRAGRASEAPILLDRAAELANDDMNLHYNIGLGYAELRDWTKAKKHADIAYAAGFPLAGLRERLRQAGAWKD